MRTYIGISWIGALLLGNAGCSSGLTYYGGEGVELRLLSNEQSWAFHFPAVERAQLIDEYVENQARNAVLSRRDGEYEVSMYLPMDTWEPEVGEAKPAFCGYPAHALHSRLTFDSHGVVTLGQVRFDRNTVESDHEDPNSFTNLTSYSFAGQFTGGPPYTQATHSYSGTAMEGAVRAAQVADTTGHL